MDKDIINRVIYFLYEKDHPLPDAWVSTYALGDSNNPVPGFEIIIPELERLKIIETSNDRSGDKQYAIPLHVRNTINSLPRQFENDPYSYFLDIEQRASEYGNERAFLEIEKLRNEFKDYPDTRARSKRSERYAIIAIVVSIVAVVLPFLCNKT